MATGVDALGRPFVERTSSLIINCHGCRYQSKHYVLKNMWVTMEIPHPEAGQPPRTVRGKVAWIQRPRTVRQLFQVALELESRKRLGHRVPPEDGLCFQTSRKLREDRSSAGDTAAEAPATENEIVMALRPDTPPTTSADNVRVFPSRRALRCLLATRPASARLVADAKQQIQAATRGSGFASGLGGAAAVIRAVGTKVRGWADRNRE